MKEDNTNEGASKQYHYGPTRSTILLKINE